MPYSWISLRTSVQRDILDPVAKLLLFNNCFLGCICEVACIHSMRDAIFDFGEDAELC